MWVLDVPPSSQGGQSPFWGIFWGKSNRLKAKKPLWDDDLSDWFGGKLNSSAVLKTLGLDPEYLPLHKGKKRPLGVSHSQRSEPSCSRPIHLPPGVLL